MMSTSFFSQSLCNSSALMRRASSAGFFGCELFCSRVLGACGRTASCELQAVNTPTTRMKLNDNRIATRIKTSPVGSLPNSQLIYNFGEQMQRAIGGMITSGTPVYRVPTLVGFFFSEQKPY